MSCFKLSQNHSGCRDVIRVWKRGSTVMVAYSASLLVRPPSLTVCQNKVVQYSTIPKSTDALWKNAFTSFSL